MKTSSFPMTIGRCLLSGLFTGLITSVIILIYNVIYRGAVDLIAYDVVMPVSIFIAFPLMNLIAGGVYFLYAGHLRNGRVWYSLTVALVTAVIALVTAIGRHLTDPDAEKFAGLLTGLELIEGVMAAFLIPLFAAHPKIFMTDKDIRGEE